MCSTWHITHDAAFRCLVTRIALEQIPCLAYAVQPACLLPAAASRAPACPAQHGKGVAHSRVTAGWELSTALEYLPNLNSIAIAQDAWNLRGTFSLSVGVMAATIVPLFAIYVRYSDSLAYRYELTPRRVHGKDAAITRLWLRRPRTCV